MWRPAVVRCGVLAALAMGACWRGNSAPRNTPIENTRPVAEAQNERVGPYWCSIRDGEYEYPEMPCAIREVDGKLVLAKLAGSQRIRGVITPRGSGFVFAGELYCPWGDCAKPLHGVFEVADDGTLRGTFDEDGMVVTLARSPADSSWGGTSYGGDGYGGFGYGGLGYGNAPMRKHPPRPYRLRPFQP